MFVEEKGVLVKKSAGDLLPHGGLEFGPTGGSRVVTDITSV